MAGSGGQTRGAVAIAWIPGFSSLLAEGEEA
jgi:hypothetical protein